MKSYGFLGLGIMGTAMARNLVQAGFDVTVWNRSREKCQMLARNGARIGLSPREVAASCDITFAMLADPNATREVCFGMDGVLGGVGPGHDFVDASTVDEETSRMIGKAVTARGARFLEAPVSGTKKPAEDGALVFLAAGDRTLFDDITPALDVMGKKHIFLGQAGQGARMKLVVNMIMGSMMAAFGEGLILAERGGLDGTCLLDILNAGAMACPMFASKGNMIVNEDFSASFPLKHMQKDLRLALSLARTLQQSFTIAPAVNEVYERAIAEDLGDEDMCSIVKVLANSGSSPTPKENPR